MRDIIIPIIIIRVNTKRTTDKDEKWQGLSGLEYLGAQTNESYDSTIVKLKLRR